MTIDEIRRLRKLHAESASGTWHYDGMHQEITRVEFDSENYWVATDLYFDEGMRGSEDEFGHFYSPTLDLIVKVHNALPGLLDAAEAGNWLGRVLAQVRAYAKCKSIPFPKCDEGFAGSEYPDGVEYGYTKAMKEIVKMIDAKRKEMGETMEVKTNE